MRLALCLWLLFISPAFAADRDQFARTAIHRLDITPALSRSWVTCEPQLAAGVSAPKELLAASVRITNGSSSGSGTVIGVDADAGIAVVLTCRHLFSGGIGTITVTFTDGTRAHAEHVASDSKADLAAVKIRATAQTPAVKIGETAAVKGKSYWQVGYPGGRGPSTKWGLTRGRGGRDVRFGFAAIGGDSGSGIFSGDGELVAVLWGGDDGETWATDLEDVHRFVEAKCCILRRPLFPLLPRFRQQQPWPPGTGPGPGAPLPAPSPGNPPAKPPGTQPPAPSPPDNSAVLAAIAELQKKVDAIKPAKDGKDGAPGPAGPAGPAGKDADPAQLAALQAKLDALQQQQALLIQQISALANVVNAQQGTAYRLIPRPK